MIQSFYNGYSGVKTQQFGVDAWSNNIANVNTNGYRANIPRFQNVFTEALDHVNASNPSPIANTQGFGVTVGSNAIDTSVGTLINADDSDFNMALGNSNGWFVVGSANEKFYTRNGAFNRDASGNIVNSDGQFLYGVNLNKIANNTITPTTDRNSDISALNSATTISAPLVISDDLRYPAKDTTIVNSSINLNIRDSLKSADTTSLLGANLNTIYGDDGVSIKTANEQITINQIDPQSGAKTPSVIDLTNINTLQDLVDNSNGLITLNGTKLKFTNPNETDIEIDFENSSQNTLKALGITSSKTIGSGSSLDSNELKLSQTTFYEKIYDVSGNEYNLKSEYTLSNRTNENQTWSVKNGIYDASGTLVSDEIKGFIQFEGSSATNVPKLFAQDGTTEVPSFSVSNFNGKTITYNPKEFTDIYGVKHNSTNIYSNSEQLQTDNNGVKDGYFSDAYIDKDGIITLNFDNGKGEIFGRVGVANFINPQGLEKMGGNLFKETTNSGAESLNWDTTTGKLKSTSVVQGKLETSNVRMETALTQLMIMQRAYSASTKSITTADDMVKEAIGLKR